MSIETRYWQDEYRKNPNDPMFDDMPGEILCLLDGTAEKTLRRCLWQIPLVIAGLLAFSGLLVWAF